MDMTFGKYKDKPVAWVMIEKPDYFDWMRSKGMEDKAEFKFMIELLQKFDAMAFSNESCNGKCKGQNPVTRFSLYKGRYNMPYWFCDDCDPYSHGALPGRLSTISSMSQAMNHRDRDNLVKLFAKAKGIPSRKTKKALKDFFNY
ncbi:hypothetical protein UY286_21415 [Paenibacillus polymyxa]|uniref:hypothetical protein n=1 Tax=Paenibacillus polymyxa TaxID=1406 RepID=UPI002AB48732|nr:hypothetical protein [Paenibacillus polymyxa]MDY7993400.1 hypothetical protein [Paenibacillus polymyxa]MDY8119999.1 hypothetical protein [Paenibacillus polymyxa]